MPQEDEVSKTRNKGANGGSKTDGGTQAQSSDKGWKFGWDEVTEEAWRIPNPNTEKALREPTKHITKSEDGPTGSPVATWADGLTWPIPQITNSEVEGIQKRGSNTSTRKGCGPNRTVKTMMNPKNERLDFKVRNGKEGDSRRWLMLFEAKNQVLQMPMEGFKDGDEAQEWFIKEVLKPWSEGSLDKAGADKRRGAVPKLFAKQMNRPS